MRFLASSPPPPPPPQLNAEIVMANYQKLFRRSPQNGGGGDEICSVNVLRLCSLAGFVARVVSKAVVCEELVIARAYPQGLFLGFTMQIYNKSEWGSTSTVLMFMLYWREQMIGNCTYLL